MATDWMQSYVLGLYAAKSCTWLISYAQGYLVCSYTYKPKGW